MKVRDLIRKLQVHDPDARVVLHGENSTYTPASYVASKPVPGENKKPKVLIA